MLVRDVYGNNNSKSQFWSMIYLLLKFKTLFLKLANLFNSNFNWQVNHRPQWNVESSFPYTPFTSIFLIFESEDDCFTNQNFHVQVSLSFIGPHFSFECWQRTFYFSAHQSS